MEASLHIAELEAERDRLREELAHEKSEHSMTWECLNMVRDELQRIGCRHGPDTHKATPPMMYPEWIRCVVDSQVYKHLEEHDRWANFKPGDMK